MENEAKHAAKFAVEGSAEQECLKLTLEVVVTSLVTNVFRWQSVSCLWTCVRERSFADLVYADAAEYSL